MKTSPIFSVLLAAALMLSNITCACAMSAAVSEQGKLSQTVDHHAKIDEPAGNMPCAQLHMVSDKPTSSLPDAHLDCDGCDELKDSCATPDYTVASTEVSRLIPLTEVDSDSDLDLISSGMDPPWRLRTTPRDLPPNLVLTAFVADTPINRKDQLTE